jgi:hypothetical protein
MDLRFAARRLGRPVLAGLAALALAVPAAQAQLVVPSPGCPVPFVILPPLQPRVPAPPAQLLPPQPLPPAEPEPRQPQPAQQPEQAPPSQPPPQPQQPPTEQPAVDPYGGGGVAAGPGETSSQQSEAGYVTSAIPVTMARLRFDAAYGANRPDRAEFFYGKCGCFGGNAPGPRLAETNVDYQDIRSYFEFAFTPRFSAFIDVPFRFLNPEQNANASGFGDIEAGFKVALLYTPDTVLSFQLKAYCPTGDAAEGLGTNHFSLEPALLLYRQLTNKLLFEGQVQDWVPIGGTDFQGNVLNYGVALSYKLFENDDLRVIPVVELMGWTVLSGQEFAFPENVTLDSAGKTIVNAKVGVRVGFGDLLETGWFSSSDLYVGYGRALTGDVWYRDILRVEYRVRF